MDLRNGPVSATFGAGLSFVHILNSDARNERQLAAGKRPTGPTPKPVHYVNWSRLLDWRY